MRDAERILHGLNDEQRQAVMTTSGPLAIIAGAGSGKTRVVSYRAAYAVATGVVPERQVLLVTFTEKAAREMATRVQRLGLGQVVACICERLADDHFDVLLKQQDRSLGVKTLQRTGVLLVEDNDVHTLRRGVRFYIDVAGMQAGETLQQL